MITEMHVDKIKATETGGRPTAADGPVEFFLWYSRYRFVILEPNSAMAVDPMEIATQRGNGIYPRRLVMNNFADEDQPAQRIELPPRDQGVPQDSYFNGVDSEDLPF